MNHRGGPLLAGALLAACAVPLSPASPQPVENPSREVPPLPGPSVDLPSPPPAPPASSAPPLASSPPPTPASGFACAPPDQGWGRHLPYRKIRGARISLPALDTPPERFDLFIHFHASDAARRGFVQEGYPAVFVGYDLGEGSNAYRRAFDDPGAFLRLLASVTEALREHTGRPARLGRIVLSSWSAGFGATQRILKQHPDRIHGLVLLDSLYAPQEKDPEGQEKPGTVFAPALAPTLAFARRALRGERALFLSYSRVPTRGYASTGEVARYLTSQLGLEEQALDPGDNPRGAVATLDRAGIHLRGFRGSDARAHCQHLALAAEASALLLKASEKKNEPPGAQE